MNQLLKHFPAWRQLGSIPSSAQLRVLHSQKSSNGVIAKHLKKLLHHQRIHKSHYCAIMHKTKGLLK